MFAEFCAAKQSVYSNETAAPLYTHAHHASDRRERDQRRMRMFKEEIRYNMSSPAAPEFIRQAQRWQVDGTVNSRRRQRRECYVGGSPVAYRAGERQRQRASQGAVSVA